jgi:DNA repair protein RadC
MKVRLKVSQKVKLSSAVQVYRVMREVLMRERTIDRSKEHFWIVCLAANNKLLLLELISFGSSRATVVEPTDVFSFALQKKAAQVIMVHNHPSGELVPSLSDKQITEKMAAIGAFVKVPVIDHLIISESGYFSFADSGLLKEIMDDTHYDLTFQQIDMLLARMNHTEKKLKAAQKEKEIKVAQAELKTEKEVKKSKLDVAKKLLKRKLSVDEIMAITGLSKKEVSALK